MLVAGAFAQEPLPQLPAATPLVELPGTPVTIAVPDVSVVRWSVAIPAAPSSSPLVAGAYVLLPSLPGLVTAYALEDGREVWRESIRAEQPLAAAGDLVFVASGEAVHALRQSDGRTMWRRPTGTVSAPLLAKDGWVIAPAQGKLHALRAADGAVVWSVDVPRQDHRATIDGDTVFVPLANGRLRALALATGAAKWEQRFAGAPVEVLVVGDRLYFGATDKFFYCVQRNSGEVDWKIRVGASVRGRAATDGDRIFFTALDNLVRAVERDTGSQRWQRGLPFRPLTGPAVAASAVMIAGPTTEVRLLNLLNGTDAGTIAFPEALSIAPAIASRPDGIFLAGVTGGLSESWKVWLASPLATR